MANPLVTLSARYQLLEKLGQGGMGAVYKAHDRLTGNTVALKRVTTPAVDLDFASRTNGSDLNLALAHEFQTLATLRHPHIISVLDYGFVAKGVPFFTMDYVVDGKSVLEAGKDQPLETKINLMIQILQALTYLHRRNLVHRDLKPANVLVADGQVKVLDFGLAVLRKESDPSQTGGLEGTVAYIAPEQFEGYKASKASDLYAVGLMAYELITGHYPFNRRTLTALMFDIVSKPVDMTSLDGALARVLERLLVKEPQQRYDDAGTVIRDLCAATNVPLPGETVAIRESFLQAAKFVGRETEMSTLLDELSSTINGNGNAWLVGGESGVGKSRLVDEMRIQALTRGVLVLQGQAVSEGGSSYHLWRNVLRGLSLYTDLDEDEASILKPLVPDMEDILARVIVDPPPLDPQPAQVRLFKTIENILDRYTGPLLIILEDLQWAGSESLALLERLIPVTTAQSLLLLGNYRDDERPDLPASLPGIQVLKLARLTESEIRLLSEAMLGTGGTQPQVVELLQRESEGNTFFAVEVARALAERAEQGLEEIAILTLPERIFAKGVEEIVQRRLSHVPESGLQLLRYAAIAGRQLDLAVLRHLEGAHDRLRGQENVDEWLTVCSNAAIFEVQGEYWRFVHDKLRERVLEEIAEDQRPDLHRQVAEAIEVIHPDTPQQIVTLAYLWRVAGNRTKELEYRIPAGHQAFANSALIEAVRHFRRARELLHDVPATTDIARQDFDLQLLIAVILASVYGFAAPRVNEAYQELYQLSLPFGQSEQQVLALYGIWLYNFNIVDYPTAVRVANQLLEIAETLNDPFLPLFGYNPVTLNNIMMGNFEAGIEYGQKVIDGYKPTYDEQSLRQSGLYTDNVAYDFMQLGIMLTGFPEKSRAILDKVRQRGREKNHPFTLVFTMFFDAMHYYFLNDPATSREWADEAISISRQYEIYLFLYWHMAFRGWTTVRMGQIDEGIQEITEAITLYESTGQKNFRPLLDALLIEAYLLAERWDDAQAQLDRTMIHFEEIGERHMEAEVHRHYGIFHLHSDNPAAAETRFMRAIDVAREQSAKWWELRAIMSLARLWQSQGKADEAKEALSTIYNWFTEGFDTHDLKEAKALLDELG